MIEKHIFAVHGFLGLFTDWNLVRSELESISNKSNFTFSGPNLFEATSRSSDLMTNLKQFLNLQKPATLAGPKHKKIYLGYSLGGRLGLRLMAEQPGLFDHWVFVSTHPGLADDGAISRELRLKTDLEWAEKITAENWESFCRQWNSQDVFSGSKDQSLKAENFNLKSLRLALTDYSLAKQPNYSNAIGSNKENLTWIVGQQDSKFLKIADDLNSRNLINKAVVAHAGHRVHIEDPLTIANIIAKI